LREGFEEEEEEEEEEEKEKESHGHQHESVETGTLETGWRAKEMRSLPTLRLTSSR
jgi:hypothetical protein